MKMFLMFIALLAVFTPSQAGVVITGEGRGVEQKVYISGDSLRFDAAGGEKSGRIIYGGGAGEKTLVVIDAAGNSYYEITPGDIEAIKNMIEQAKRTMEQVIQHLPEAQREQVMGSIRDQFGAASADRKVKLERRGVKANGWTADKYAFYLDGKKDSLAWFAETSQFNLAPEDFKILKEFEKFWEPLASMNMPQGLMMFAEGEAKGIPVRAVKLDGKGAESLVFKVSEVVKTKLDASIFEIPDGLRRMKLPLPGR